MRLFSEQNFEIKSMAGNNKHWVIDADGNAVTNLLTLDQSEAIQRRLNEAVGYCQAVESGAIPSQN